jgi:hypothetical protein
VSPLKKLFQNYTKKQISGKSKEKDNYINLSGKNYFKNKTMGEKKNTKTKNSTFVTKKKQNHYRQWSPISQKLLNIRKKVLKKK